MTKGEECYGPTAGFAVVRAGQGLWINDRHVTNQELKDMSLEYFINMFLSKAIYKEAENG